MGSFAVDAAQLASVEMVIENCVEQAHGGLIDLRAAATALNWRGAAGGCFRIAYAQWEADVELLLTALTTLADATAQSGHDYAATETAVSVAVTGTSA